MQITIEQRVAREYGEALEDAGIDHGITYLYDSAIVDFDIVEECEALEILRHIEALEILRHIEGEYRD